MNFARIVPLALATLLSVPVAGSAVAGDARESQRPQHKMGEALQLLAAHAQNARVKMNSRVGGFGRGAAGVEGDSVEDLSRGGRIGRNARPEQKPLSGKPSVCCERNMEVIAEQLDVIEAILVDYARAAGEDATAREKIAAMGKHWNTIQKSMLLFASTDSRDIADSGIGAALGAIADLQAAHAEYLDCCGPPPGWNQQS